jgi:GxxExxY protein
MNNEELNSLSKKIIGHAIDVHRRIGPGFAEKIYHKALENELRKGGLKVLREAQINVVIDGVLLGKQRVDLLIEGENQDTPT